MSKEKFERLKPHLNADDEVSGIIARASILQYGTATESVHVQTPHPPTNTSISLPFSKDTAALVFATGIILLALVVFGIKLRRRRSILVTRTAERDIFERKLEMV